MVLYKHEMKMNCKSLMIWTLCVAFICFGCIMLYTGLEDSIQEIADSFSNMGAMSAALGMDKMSLATLEGYFATEIAMMHSLGGAMFAAVLGVSLVAKEESGHTAEFLNVLPIGRGKIIGWKYLTLVTDVIVFNLICIIFYFLGFVMMGEKISVYEMMLYHFAAGFMQLEIGTVCFMVSVLARRNLVAAGLGITLILFAADMMCRILPSIENLKYITPFYYANAADIFTEGKINAAMLAAGAGIMAVSYAIAWGIYRKKDL